MPPVRLARSNEEILSCFPAMAELRPHLRREDFLSRIRRQQQTGYQLAFLETPGPVACVAGYRFLENLAWGRFLYVDDLVTASTAQGQGYGRAMLEWLIAEARRHQGEEFHLDSGVHRFAAHRLYHRHHLTITSHHFSLTL